MACKHCHAHADHGHDHGRGHDEHEVDGSETAEQDREEEEEDPKRALRKVIVSAVLLLAAYLIERSFDLPLPGQLLLFLPAYVVAGGDVVKEAVENLMAGDPFDEDFLMAVATIGALLIAFIPGGEPMFAEAVFVMLFFEVGELFETIAENNSRRSISELMDIRPDFATIERASKLERIDPAKVEVGEVIVVAPGERVPLDGTIIEGSTSLNTVALTGESEPRDASVTDKVISGCVNLSGVIRVRVDKSFGDSTASKILELVENASDRKSRSENFITRFAKVYTPIVVFLALALAIVPPLASGDVGASFATWLLRALTFLVVSCPCALVLSVPLTFFGGIGGASKQGILIKGSGFMETLARSDTMVFDKTGTLTKGVFQVMAVHPNMEDKDRLLHLAAHVERYSTHPIAEALRDAFPCEGDDCSVLETTEVAGKGIIATVNGRRVAVGNTVLMDELGAAWHSCKGDDGTVIHVAIDGRYAGHVLISDEVKGDAAQAISQLKAEGVTRVVMLTGDRDDVARRIAGELGLDEYHSELLPADKVEHVERLMRERAEGRSLAFVGDGINDAPVLARADVGIAMGAMGSDAAIEAADVVLMDDMPSRVAASVRIARRTLGDGEAEHRVRDRGEGRYPAPRGGRPRPDVARRLRRRGRHGALRAQRHPRAQVMDEATPSPDVAGSFSDVP